MITNEERTVFRTTFKSVHAKTIVSMLATCNCWVRSSQRAIATLGSEEVLSIRSRGSRGLVANRQKSRERFNFMVREYSRDLCLFATKPLYPVKWK
jgi:hypothetical protein